MMLEHPVKDTAITVVTKSIAFFIALPPIAALLKGLNPTLHRIKNDNIINFYIDGQ